MSPSDDNQDHPSTLPSPELNPLTNPVLGRNMGRWAEVYFTSAPENREQAVRELLRELESGSSAADETPVTSEPLRGQQDQDNDRRDSGQQDDGQQKTATELPAEAHTSLCPDSPEAAPLQEHFVQCGRCGTTVLAEQPFCGECGFPMPAREAKPAEEDAFVEAGGEPYENTDLLRTRFAEAVPTLFAEHQQERQRRSRLTMTIALTILVGTLFYVAARQTSAWLRAHGAPRTPTAEPTAQGRPSLPPPAINPEAAAPTGRQSEGPSPASIASPSGSSVTLPAGKRNPLAAKESSGSGNVKDEKLSPTAEAGGRGAEELAIAESYLSGTQGKARDSAQAAQWLWKSVGKQNTAAALLLSDLYVTGDGVARNCDQARLLLGAAASKGAPGAGERIRDLPNLGCQ